MSRHIYTLDPTEDVSWSLWPLFERRVREVSPEIATETPVDHIIQMCRMGFSQNAPTIRCWVLLDDEESDPNGIGSVIRGHAIGYVQKNWDKWEVLIHQLHVDKRVLVLRTMLGDFMDEVSEWVDLLNRLGIDPPITEMCHMAVRGDAWYRAWKGEARYDRSVLRIPVKRHQRPNILRAV